MQKNSKMKTISKAKSLDSKNLILQMFMITFSTAVILTVLLWAQIVWAFEKKANLNENPIVQQEAAEFIQKLADKALTSLKNSDNSLADQEVRFRGILLEGFDVNYIGKISLGRHRKQASTANLNNYYALFPEYLVKVYTSRLTKLDTREVRVGKTLPNGKKDMYVRTKVIDDEDKIFDVDWRVRPVKPSTTEPAPQERRYKIIDVKIEGISMARTQRDDFTSRIAESGISGLIDFMRSIIEGTVMVAENDKKNKKPEPEQTQ